MALHHATEILLFNGSIKPVSKLTLNDMLIGDDSKPRQILQLTTQKSVSIEFITSKKYRFVVSPDQNLILRKSPYLNKPYFNIKLNRYKNKFTRYGSFVSIKASHLQVKGNSFKRSFLLYKSAVDYPARCLPIDPYFLGLWLGDGHRHLPALTTMDSPIVEAVHLQAKMEGLLVREYKKKNCRAKTYILVNPDNRYGMKKNPLKEKLNKLSLINNKHIPEIYLINSYENRLQLLAGLIDTDGYLNHNYYCITQKNIQLTNQICQLANSLGFYSTIRSITKGIKRIGFIGSYYDIIICGKINEIPSRLDRKKVLSVSEKYDRRSIGYKISSGPISEMVSLMVDGNGQFLLGNGTIIGGTTSLDKTKKNDYRY